MRPHANHAQAVAGPPSRFAIFEKEVDTTLRPIHPAVADRKPAFFADGRFQTLEYGVKTDQIIDS